MRRARIPFEARDRAGFREHRLPERGARQRGGVEAREGVKRIALDLAAPGRRVQKAEVERRVVANEDRAPAVVQP